MRTFAYFSLLASLSLAIACSDEGREPSMPADATVRADAEAPDLGGFADAAEDAGVEADAAEEDVGPADAGGGPMVVGFAASAAQAMMGETVTLTWEVTGATSVSIAAMPGGTLLDSSPMLTGMLDTPPINFTTSFTLTAADAENRTATRMITVSYNPGEPVVVSFIADPDVTVAEETTTLRWETTNANRVRILQGANELFNSTTMVATGEYTTPPLMAGVHPFTLEASNFANQTTALVIVTAN